MPTYRYLCDNCGTSHEEVNRMSECGNPSPCPECEHPAKMVFTPTIHLYVPSHFRHTTGWNDPDPGDPNWANIGTTNEKQSQVDHSFSGARKRENWDS